MRTVGRVCIDLHMPVYSIAGAAVWQVQCYVCMIYSDMHGHMYIYAYVGLMD